MTDLALHSDSVSAQIDSQPPQLAVTLRDLSVDGEWITGQVEANASAFGAAVKGIQPFKAKNNEPVTIQMAGAMLDLTVEVRTPTQVCASATLHWGMINLKTSEQCTDI